MWHYCTGPSTGPSISMEGICVTGILHYPDTATLHRLIMAHIRVTGLSDAGRGIQVAGRPASPPTPSYKYPARPVWATVVTLVGHNWSTQVHPITIQLCTVHFNTTQNLILNFTQETKVQKHIFVCEWSKKANTSIENKISATEIEEAVAM